MSARELRSQSGFPANEIFVQREAVAGPNNTVVNADITLDLEGETVIRIIGTEITFDSPVVGGTTKINGIATLNPDKTTLAENLTDRGDDDTIHEFTVEKDVITAVGVSHIKLSDYRQYSEHGITYAQQRFRFLFFSSVNLSGGFFSGALYYRLGTVTELNALAILRRR